MLHEKFLWKLLKNSALNVKIWAKMTYSLWVKEEETSVIFKYGNTFIITQLNPFTAKVTFILKITAVFNTDNPIYYK
jgi:hypothetical protein